VKNYERDVQASKINIFLSIVTSTSWLTAIIIDFATVNFNKIIGIACIISIIIFLLNKRPILIIQFFSVIFYIFIKYGYILSIYEESMRIFQIWEILIQILIVLYIISETYWTKNTKQAEKSNSSLIPNKF